METEAWSRAFFTILQCGDFTPETIARIYQLEMEARTFFDWGGIVPDFLVLQDMEQDAGRMQYDWASRSRDAVCPACETLSQMPAHDYFEKVWQDLPQGGRAVWHRVRRQLYVCENAACPHHEFVERLPGFAEDHARQTLRFKRYCIIRALDSGCKPAEDALKREGASVSNDTIARYVKAASAKQIDANLVRNDVRVLAVDDIYLQKGNKETGCTVFLDEETHRVLVIVRGTTKAVVQRALQYFPAAEFFSRDRASAYSAAATEYGKTQIADRFHLIANAQHAVKDALMTEVPATIFIREGDGWVPADPDPGRRPDRHVFTVPEDQVADRIRLAHLTPTKAQKYRHTLKVLELVDRGLRSAEIAQTLGISLRDVQQLRRVAVNTLDMVETQIRTRIQQANDAQSQQADRAQDRHPQTIRPQAWPAQTSIVEPYRDTVIHELKQGANFRTIHPLVQAQGFTGSANAVYQYILKLRQEIPDALRPEDLEPPADLTLKQISRDTIYKQILKEAATSRPTKADTTAAPVPAKTRPGAPSPLSDQAHALIFGDPPTEDPTAKHKKKRNASTASKPPPRGTP